MFWKRLFGRKKQQPQPQPQQKNVITLRTPEGLGLEKDYHLKYYRADYMGGGHGGITITFHAAERLVTYSEYKHTDKENIDEKDELSIPDSITTKHELIKYIQEQWEHLPSFYIKNLNYIYCDCCGGRISLYDMKFYNLSRGHSICENCTRKLLACGYLSEENIVSITDFTQKPVENEN